MNKFLLILIILSFSCCQIFNTKRNISRKELNSIVLHANINTDIEHIGGAKIKTKIHVLKDEIIVSVSPVFGIELGKLIIKENIIYIDQKFKNKVDSIMIKSIDPKFKIKTIQKSIIQLKHKKDSILYKNKYINCVFTDYVYKNNLFLPSKILFQYNNFADSIDVVNSVNLEYKSVVFKNE